MTQNPPDFTTQVAECRAYLLRFARLQLRNDAWAEDAVSETVLAALARPQAFEGRSQNPRRGASRYNPASLSQGVPP